MNKQRKFNLDKKELNQILTIFLKINNSLLIMNFKFQIQCKTLIIN